MNDNSKKNILIVDDQELNRNILSLILREEYNVVEAVNGKVAWDVMLSRGREISLILLDIIMPVMDGMEFLKCLQNRRDLKDIPVIFVTTEAYTENITGGFKMGVRDVIAKPFDPYLVRNRVNNLIHLTSNDAKKNFHAGIQMKNRRPSSVLIIDDEEINRGILKNVLHDQYTILEASDGEEGLAQISAHVGEIAAVLLDIIMPVMDGIEMVRQVKRRRLLMGVPIIAITAEDSVSKLEQIRNFGIYEVIPKPFNPFIVRNRVDNMIELSGQRLI